MLKLTEFSKGVNMDDSGMFYDGWGIYADCGGYSLLVDAAPYYEVALEMLKKHQQAQPNENFFIKEFDD